MNLLRASVSRAYRWLRNNAPVYLYYLLCTSAGRCFLCFLVFYLGLIQYCRHAFYRDPTSAFFDYHRGYERSYSLQRQRQADDFIQAANVSAEHAVKLPGHPNMCVGMTTVERPSEQYVRSAYGSLMDTLTAEERRQIYAIVLIAHTDPNRHPIYHEPWLETLSDRILTYDSAKKEQFQALKRMEEERDYRRKAIFDYTYLLETCVETGAAWIAMVEDDTLAVAGWYPRVLGALDATDSKSSNWLYLRMFFTEQFLGWNSEYWPAYLISSASIVSTLAAVLLALRRVRYLKSLSNAAIFVACFICTPACILLYFMAGRLSMRPLSPGVHEMPNFGCCGQGFVFPSAAAVRVVEKLKEKQVGFVDMTLEEWANEERLTRFAVVPSLLQHIGGRSSKGDDFSSTQPLSVAERIFNFGFELYQEKGGKAVHPIDE
ncbi:MAG: hypothetical protein Q9201_000357 [Fulgogasparrea decipioides]